ncbi:hypothetical protein Tco_1467479 [Tanacetum coccineum]
MNHLLCKQCPDSHRHFFACCNYSINIWTVLKRKVRSSTLPNDWKGIIDALVKLDNNNAIRSILRNERNKRLFDKESRNVKTITRLIIKYVKLKLISLKVKQSVQILVYNQNAAATRNAKLIGALQKFVGPGVKAFLSL